MHDFGDVTLACDDDKRVQAHEVVRLVRAGVQVIVCKAGVQYVVRSVQHMAYMHMNLKL